MGNFDHLLSKLNEMLSKVTDLEKKSIEYKIKKIEEQQKDFDNNFNISTERLVSVERLSNKIHIEKNLIIGYKKIIEGDSICHEVVKDMIDLSKYKIVTYEKLLDKIKLLYKSNFEKICGCVDFNFIKFEFDPIFEIERVHFYVDSILKINYDFKDKKLEVAFESATELEIFLIGSNSIILGSILIPCDFFIEKEDTFLNIDFGNYNFIYTKVTFKKEIRLIRKNAGVVCVYKNGHGLETMSVYTPRLCGVCHTFLTLFVNCYRCFRCKFTCHKKCSDLILFNCKGVVEEDRNFNLYNKNYGISHNLKKINLSGFRYCYHCGDRIQGDFILTCTRCHHCFHLECENFLFDSCQLDLHLRTSMCKFIPKKTNLDFNLQKYKIEDFELIKTLGKGNFGKVIISRLKKNNETVALKILRKDQMMCQNEAKYVDIERRVLKKVSQCNHPFLNHMYFCFQDKKYIYFALEYLQGGDLFHHILKRKFTNENLKLYASEILLGLEYLHKNEIVYRDLKLNNILLTKEGHVKLCDFGLCKENMTFESVTYTFCGTLDTIAPEIIINKGYTSLVDLWSYGVILYELYIKTPPFPGATNRDICQSILKDEPEFNNKISENVKDLIQKLLVKNPKERMILQEIKKHEYFSDTNWNDIYNLKIKPDFVPGSDISNFDSEFTSDLILLPRGNEVEKFDIFFENFK